MSPLDLQRLAARIERLQQARTHGWHGGDDLTFKNTLPGGRGRQTLPDPDWLRRMAKVMRSDVDMPENDLQEIRQNWRNWVTWAMRLEGLIRDNDPRNPKRMLRDMARGKFPFGR